MPNTAVDMNFWAVSACYPRSTFYPLERWPFHSEPPDHYDLLSYLLDLSVSQLLAYAIALNLLMSDQD